MLGKGSDFIGLEFITRNMKRRFVLTTLPIAKIISVKNARAWVSMVLFFKK